MINAPECDLTGLIHKVANHVSVKPQKTVKTKGNAELTDVQKVVRAYRRLINVPDSDEGWWNKAYFKRNSASAKVLVDMFQGDMNKISECMIYVSDEFKENKLPWTFETIVKWAGHWKIDPNWKLVPKEDK